MPCPKPLTSCKNDSGFTHWSGQAARAPRSAAAGQEAGSLPHALPRRAGCVAAQNGRQRAAPRSAGAFPLYQGQAGRLRLGLAPKAQPARGGYDALPGLALAGSGGRPGVMGIECRKTNRKSALRCQPVTPAGPAEAAPGPAPPQYSKRRQPHGESCPRRAGPVRLFRAAGRPRV